MNTEPNNPVEEGDVAEDQEPAQSVQAPPSVAKSQLTSKTYISQLEKQLNEERTAREKLQNEIEQIKKVNAEISSKLGLKSQTTQQ